MKGSKREKAIYSNLEGEVEFSLCNNKQTFSLFLNLLKKDCKNPVRSAITEIIYNAVDASRSNNINRLDIWINRDENITNSPSNNLLLSIRDYGIGIDDNIMNKYFSKFGISSKSNQYIPHYGIGICYLFFLNIEHIFINSFHYINGDLYKTIYILFINESGIPCYIKALEEQEPISSKECTGTIVKFYLEENKNINDIILYTLESTFLLDIDIYTNISLLKLLRNYSSSRYINLNKSKESIEGFFLLDNNYSNIYNLESRILNNGYEESIISLEEKCSYIKNNTSNTFSKELELSKFNIKKDNLVNIILKGDYYCFEKYREILSILLSRFNSFYTYSSIGVLLGDYINEIDLKGTNLRFVLSNLLFTNSIYIKIRLDSIRTFMNYESIIPKESIIEIVEQLIISLKKEVIDLIQNFPTDNLIDIINCLHTIDFFNRKLGGNKEKKLYSDRYKLHFTLESYINNQSIWKNNIFNYKQEVNPYNIFSYIINTFDSYIIGPLNVLDIKSKVYLNISKCLGEGKYVKNSLSKLNKDRFNFNRTCKLFLELVLHQRLKVIISNGTSIKYIRSKLSYLDGDIPFILIIEKNLINLNIIYKSLGSYLLGCEIVIQDKDYKKKALNKLSPGSIKVLKEEKLLDYIDRYPGYRLNNIKLNEYSESISKLEFKYLPHIIYYHEHTKNNTWNYHIIDLWLAGHILNRKNRRKKLYIISSKGLEVLKDSGYILIESKEYMNRVYKFIYKKDPKLIISFYSLVRSTYNLKIECIKYIYLIEEELNKYTIKLETSLKKLLNNEYLKVLLNILDIKENTPLFGNDVNPYIYKSKRLNSILNHIQSSISIYINIYSKEVRITKYTEWLYVNNDIGDKYYLLKNMNSLSNNIFNKETGELKEEIREYIKYISEVNDK